MKYKELITKRLNIDQKNFIKTTLTTMKSMNCFWDYKSAYNGEYQDIYKIFDAYKFEIQNSPIQFLNKRANFTKLFTNIYLRYQ